MQRLHLKERCAYKSKKVRIQKQKGTHTKVKKYAHKSNVTKRLVTLVKLEYREQVIMIGKRNSSLLLLDFI